MGSPVREYLNSLEKWNNILYEGDVPATSPTEKTYLNVREAENRLYTDDELKELPFLKNHIHGKEWKLRARSATRLSNYFNLKDNGEMLDLGCGNGWLTHIVSQNDKLEVVGIDLNHIELSQACRVFEKPNLTFLYGDIFTMSLPWASFDYILVCAAIQYFKSFKSLIDRLMILLKEDGELHIIDSPFYQSHEVADARQRSINYYRSLGYGHMANHYFHHTFEDLENWHHEYLYTYHKPLLFGRIFDKKDIPFPWIKITKHKKQR